MNTYLIKSKYLSEERIDAYFKPKGWIKFDAKKHQNPTLIYVDGMNIYDRSLQKYQTFVKNQIGNSKNFLSDKDNLANIVPKKYENKSISINLKTDDLDQYEKFFKKGKVWILKPARGRQGIGIKIVTSFGQFKHYLKKGIRKIDFKKIKRLSDWIMQEYIVSPILYEGRKFHLRVYFMVFENNIYLFPHYLIITAKEKYKKSDFFNKDIHDTHYDEGSIRNKIFPQDTGFTKKELDNIQSNMLQLFKYLKENMIEMECYPEDQNCYEVFAADMMLTDTLKLKILEINARMGWPATMDRNFNLFEDQLNIVLGKLFSFEIKENEFILI